MIRLGKTYGDLMVDVAGTNEKLRARARARRSSRRPERRPTRWTPPSTAADGSAKVAIVSLLAGLEADAARARLERANGKIRVAFAEATA